MAGYSDKPLLEKLGYKPGESIYLVHAPDWFRQELKNGDVQVSDLPADWAHGFFTTQVELESFLKKLKLDQIGRGLWVSWPKKVSGVNTDLTEHTLRDQILPLGWVDIKVVAVDDTWTGFKFTRRRN